MGGIAGVLGGLRIVGRHSSSNQAVLNDFLVYICI